MRLRLFGEKPGASRAPHCAQNLALGRLSAWQLGHVTAPGASSTSRRPRPLVQREEPTARRSGHGPDNTRQQDSAESRQSSSSGRALELLCFLFDSAATAGRAVTMPSPPPERSAVDRSGRSILAVRHSDGSRVMGARPESRRVAAPGPSAAAQSVTCRMMMSTGGTVPIAADTERQEVAWRFQPLQNARVQRELNPVLLELWLPLYILSGAFAEPSPSNAVDLSTVSFVNVRSIRIDCFGGGIGLLRRE